MRRQLIPALAGLALALVLAVTATVGASSGTTADSGAMAPEPSDVVAAGVSPAITVPLIDTIPSGDDVDSYRPTPGPTDEEIVAYVAAVEQAEAEAARQAEANRQAEAARQAAAASPGSVQEIIARYFGSQTQKALSVVRCESRFDPNAMSPGGGNHGLFQINNVHSGNFQAVTGVPWSGRYDAEANTRFAKWLYDQSGWGPWACA